MKNKLWQKTD